MGAESYATNGVFVVSIYGVDLSFSKISGIGSSVEYDTYTEGGGRVNILLKPKSSAGTITFEKGLSVVDQSTAAMFIAGAQTGDIVINIVKNGKFAESYYIESGVTVAWETGDLDAISGGVLIKRFTVAHTGLRIIG